VASLCSHLHKLNGWLGTSSSSSAAASATLAASTLGKQLSVLALLDKLARLCPGVLVEADPARPQLPAEAQGFVVEALTQVLTPGAPLSLKLGALQLLPHLVRGTGVRRLP
jgi:hypothetical protein